jgi:aminopeptidase N
MDGVWIETWAYPQDRDAWFRAFAVTRRVAEFYAFRVGPYAYEKLASVESRTRFGGMENAGNIFYTEKLGVARGAEGIAAHEIAHQWFGDSVTESD